jgi:uncharacterized protein
MTNENRKRNLRLEMERGAQALAAARLLLEGGLYADAASRAYYAALYHARALLLTEGEEPITHHGVQRVLSRDFVRTGQLTPEIARAFSNVEKLRLDADYAAEILVTRADATQAILTVEGFIETVTDLLRAGMWLEEPPPRST